MTDDISVTAGQISYLKSLKDGQKTTHELVLERMVTANSITKAMKGLCALGLVEHKTVVLGGRGRRYAFKLTESYDVLLERVTIRKERRRDTIVDADIECVVQLRAEGCTGQELFREFRKRRSERTDASIKHIVNIARRHREWQ